MGTKTTFNAVLFPLAELFFYYYLNLLTPFFLAVYFEHRIRRDSNSTAHKPNTATQQQQQLQLYSLRSSLHDRCEMPISMQPAASKQKQVQCSAISFYHCSHAVLRYCGETIRLYAILKLTYLDGQAFIYYSLNPDSIVHCFIRCRMRLAELHAFIVTWQQRDEFCSMKCRKFDS